MKRDKYLKALLEIAKEKNKLDLFIIEFEALKQLLDQNSDWLKMISLPSIATSKKEEMIKSIGFDEDFSSFLIRLVLDGLIESYNQLFIEWMIMARRSQKVAYVGLYSAKTLTEAQKTVLERLVKPYLGGLTVEFYTVIDENLISGVKVIYQSQSLDGSLAYELKELESLI
ncbi:ATP synthase subunit delta (ATP synthase F(1) sector subunit delta) [Paracholeplasma brassicae]|uniref:ATP synthase subunit delta (ATP synthase F(1) sector subunit delta) n=1 Tax=Acholeplasma brassicae TaxID=61635 RepID=U4KSZ0_9MOLU|nr:ATP synthase F1 subunit delta [Paracholeplasma brassicae]CCV65774.1 ATP synthase subunit delta (ATP synthase F(1) sector subunit delta) [Paracholeplasma brassicae]